MGERGARSIDIIRGYHGGAEAVYRFDPEKTVDGGFHFGDYNQALMRASGARERVLTEVEVEFRRLQRSRDTGGHWKALIANAKRKGCDGIVYLNRYEGIQIDSILKAQEAGIEPDNLSDTEFRRWFPEAKDSYIAFYVEQIRVVLHHRVQRATATKQSSPAP